MCSFLMRPKVDFAFKEIMMDEKARIGFLSAILHIPPEEIKTTEILNTYLRKVHERDKQGILDVRVRLNGDTEIDVEIQLAEFKAWAARSLFYLSKMYTDQIEAGEDYDKLKKCVSISILDFELFPQAQKYYSCFHVWEDETHTLFTDRIEFHVLELPKLPKGLKAGDSVLLWAKFISAEKQSDFDALIGKDVYLDSAYRRLQVISQDEAMQIEYDGRMKALRDYNQLVRENREEGRREGMNLMIRKMLLRGDSVESVAELTGLTIQQVKELANGGEV